MIITLIDLKELYMWFRYYYTHGAWWTLGLLVEFSILIYLKILKYEFSEDLKDNLLPHIIFRRFEFICLHLIFCCYISFYSSNGFCLFRVCRIFPKMKYIQMFTTYKTFKEIIQQFTQFNYHFTSHNTIITSLKRE